MPSNSTRILLFTAVTALFLSSCKQNKPKPYTILQVGGRTVVGCQIDTKNTCVLTLDYLRGADSQPYPILFDRKKMIIYISDAQGGGGHFDFQPFQHVDCDHPNQVISQSIPPKHNDQPFKSLPSSGNPVSIILPSQFDADSGQCYKHVIKGSNGETDVDPHIIIGG